MRKKINSRLPFEKSPSTGTLLIVMALMSSLPVTTAAEPKPSTGQINGWIVDLNSDNYFERRLATESLILAGKPVIEPLFVAIQQGSLETVARGMHVLRELALMQDGESETAAFRALEQLAAKRVTLAARRAAKTLASLGEIRHDRARDLLAKKNATITRENIRVGPDVGDFRDFPCIIIGDDWNGTVDDIRQIRWIVGVNSQSQSPFRRPWSQWLIVLQGRRVTNEYLQAVCKLDNIAAVRIRKSKIDAEGIATLKNLRSLRYLDILYNPLQEKAFETLKTLQSPMRFRLYGTHLDSERIANELATKEGFEIDARDGAFLGISCGVGCRVSYVGENTAAKLGGIQLGDIILSYEGTEIKTFDELTKLIGQNAPGDTVSLKVNRMGQVFEFKVTLGEWPR